MIGPILAFGLKLVTGPYLMAALITAALAIVVPVVGFKTWLWVHDGKITTAAVARCEAEERAERLMAQNQALIAAKRTADATLEQRGKSIERSEERIQQLENDREALRAQLQQTDDASHVVFRSDDPWWVPRRATRPAPVAGR